MNAMTGRNPYRPGAATQPLYLAGRDPLIKSFGKILGAAPEIPANLRIIGLRGVGKSVLLQRYESRAAEDGWAVVRQQLEPRHNSEANLSTLVTNLCTAATTRMSRTRRVKAKLTKGVEAGRRLVQVSYEDITFALAGAEQEQGDCAKQLYAAVTAALDTGHQGFALLFDEAQVIKDERKDEQHPLSMLLAAVNTLQENGLPIALVMCGLPTLRTNIQRARTYSERMFRGQTVGALDRETGDARDAFVEPLHQAGMQADDDLISLVLDEVEGYPFFIQLWGAELWDAAYDAGLPSLTVPLLQTIQTDIYTRLDEEFYAGRVDTLTPSEQDLLMATADCTYPPLRTAEIQNVSHKSQGNINVLMGRLTEEGVLYRTQKGVYQYTAPKFHDYLVRRAAAARN